MNLLQFPWIVAVLFGFFLLVLAFREWYDGRALPPVSPERGIAFFHAGLLVFLTLLISYGTFMLYRHTALLEQLVTLYPHARYAPEREAFTDRGEWVFVSHDTATQIVDWYRSTQRRLGYVTVHDRASSTDRLLFERDHVRLFLTIEDEGPVRVLYYSESGEVRVVEVP